MPINSCYLFQGLSPSQIEQITAVTEERQLKKGQWLFYEDQEAEHLYLVKDGAVELVIKVDDTIEIPIAITRPDNGCLGVSALIEPYLYSLSARSLDDSTLLTIPRTRLDDLMNADPDMRCIIMTNLSKKLLNRLKETRQEIRLHFMNLVRSITF